MEQQRARSRAGAGRAEVEAAEFARAAGFDDRVRRLREDRGPDPDRRARAARGRAVPRQAARVAVLRGRRRPGHRPGLHRARGDRRPGAPARGATGSATTRCSSSRAKDSPRATASAPSCSGRRASRRWPTTPRRTSCTRRCARSSATTCEQAGSAVRPDKLRFDFTHDRALTDEERERVERIVNEKVFENLPVRAFETPLAEAQQARRDDAVRREVRRGGARGRDPGLLARALRRNARALDRGDRAVRPALRELGRERRTPDRGAHRGRGVRMAPRARARGGESSAASSSGCARRRRRRRLPLPARRWWTSGGTRPATSR